MGDSAIIYKAMKKNKKERHKNWLKENRQIIRDSGIPYSGTDLAYLFREDGKPVVDFYPSTGRWRVPHDNKTYKGGAKSFLKWYEKQ